MRRGLDSRYMISQLRPTDFKILSLTTIATPHRGSAFADYMFQTIGRTSRTHSWKKCTKPFPARRIKRVYSVMEYFGFETGAFSQLTQEYMQNSFNPKTPDIPDVRYFSYGASLEPTRWSVFAPSHAIIKQKEGVNDGLVRCVYSSRSLCSIPTKHLNSVQSSRWGDYKGTLIGVSHLDLINWTNRLKWFFWELTGSKRKYEVAIHNLV
ncbi:hypothetical protein IG631_15425 [Alternaria alternata]|jgi:triacylglycerol lipase|nr:hypothetical protein IG631_15425 [Alternaria alternata]